MKEWAVTLAILLLVPGSFGLAEDFTTVAGKVYKDAIISRVEGDGLVLRTKTGISKVYFVELPKGVQERFHFRQGTPIPAQHAQTPVKVEVTQARPRHGTGGPKMVVVGQRSLLQQTDSQEVAGALLAGFSLRLLGIGAVIIGGIVLVIVRQRSS